MSAPTIVSAAQSVGEYLQSPDDLVKISAFRKKLEKEKASIDAKLKNGVKDQLDGTRDGLRKLFATRASIQVVKDEMFAIDRLCRDPQNVVSTFDQISRVRCNDTLCSLCDPHCFPKVSVVHRNFERTEEMVNNIIDMHDKLTTLEGLLASDRKKILGPAPNLLAIHYQINQLEAFRNQTMHQAKKASLDSRNTLNRWFERLNSLIEAFDEHIFELARNVLPLVRAGSSEVVVKLIKIAEVEGREDEKVCQNIFSALRRLMHLFVGYRHTAS